MTELEAYELGYRVAAREISEGIASFAMAKERGLFEGDSNSRIAWDQGYDACVCAYRLGHNIDEMIAAKMFEPSISTMAHVVFSLLDMTWPRQLRDEPRIWGDALKRKP